MKLITMTLNDSVAAAVEKIRGNLSAGLFIKKKFLESMGVETFYYENKCLRCSHAWTGRVESPIYCPVCKSPGWKSAQKKEMRFPQLRDLKEGETCILPWGVIRPDYKPQMAVAYERRRYGKKFFTQGKSAGLEVTRMGRRVEPDDESVPI